MNTPPPRRRWLRRVLVVAALVAGALAFGAWRFAGDRERVAEFLAERARSALGVELAARGEARLAWWPSPGIRLGDVVVTDASGAPLLSARTLAARVPWSTLWSRELHVESLEAEGARVELAGISRLVAARRDDGPPAPLRWPRLDAALALDDAIVVREDGSELRVDLEVGPVAAGAPLHVRATLADGAAPLTIALDGVATEAADGIGVDDARATLARSGDAAPVAFRGRIALASASDWSVDGTLESGALPAWLAASVPGAAGAPVQLELAVARDSALAVRARGTFAGAAVDADLAGIELPATNDPAAVLALLASPTLRGTATVDRIGLGDVVLEGVRFDAERKEPAAQ
ncbi:MAG TPA: hypothetical protein VFL14_09485 [Xanthomonadales bacterium]|nr:hypothetical protein [Xanthomonadales bacterium]